MTAVEDVSTSLMATEPPFPVSWILYLRLSVVVRTLDGEARTHAIWIVGHNLKDLVPQGVFGKLGCVPKDVESESCTGERNTNSVGDFEETDLPLLVASHQGEQHDGILLTLVRVNGSNTNVFTSKEWFLLQQLQD